MGEIYDNLLSGPNDLKLGIKTFYMVLQALTNYGGNL